MRSWTSRPSLQRALVFNSIATPMFPDGLRAVVLQFGRALGLAVEFS
jgi:hypothetical protein